MWVVGREYIDREGTKWLDLEAGNLTSGTLVSDWKKIMLTPLRIHHLLGRPISS